MGFSCGHYDHQRKTEWNIFQVFSFAKKESESLRSLALFWERLVVKNLNLICSKGSINEVENGFCIFHIHIMLKQIEQESHVEVLVHGPLKAVVGLLPSLPLQALHSGLHLFISQLFSLLVRFIFIDNFFHGLHLLHLLLVRLDKAVSKLGGEAGCLLQEGFALNVGGDSNLSGKPRHLPHL